MKNRLLGLWMSLVLIAGALDIAQVTGCASTNPIAAARDVNQKAYALYGSFVIFEERAAIVIKDPGVGLPLKKAIQVADAKAKPSADALANALRDYESAAASVRSGAGTAAQLSIATNNVGTWIARAQTDITALISAVNAGVTNAPPPTTRTRDRAIPACDDSKPQVCLL